MGLTLFGTLVIWRGVEWVVLLLVFLDQRLLKMEFWCLLRPLI